MKYSCGLIRDLLPLYVDKVCSADSRKAVEEHIFECNECQSLLNDLRNGESEEILETEKAEVLSRHSKKERRKTFIIGIIAAALFMIPVIVCLIVNLAVGHGLDWFFIVLASLGLTASVTVLPMLAVKYRFPVTLCGATACLMLLMMTVCIYTGGNWFFVAASSSLFGLCAAFLPIVFRCLPQKGALRAHKGLLSLAADTLLYFVMMIFIGLYINADNTFWGITLTLSAVFVPVVWVVFLLLRYWHTNPLIKSGALTAALSVAAFFSNYLINRLLITFSIESRPEYASIQLFKPFEWNIDTVNWNINWLIMIAGIITGAALVIAGIVRRKR